MINDRDILRVFSENLLHLTKTEHSVSALCRKLGINRSQFNRYLSGQASPRPVILQRICKHFGCDARILLEPLDSIETKTPPQGQTSPLHPLLSGSTVMDLPTTMLPDGIYLEWKKSVTNPGYFTTHLIRFHSEDGIRRFRFKSADPVDEMDNGKRFSGERREFTGIIFRQGDGFVTIDCTHGSQLLAFTSYRLGYMVNSNTHPGYKLAGKPLEVSAIHGRTSCVLVFLDQNTKSILEAARFPVYVRQEDAPNRIQKIIEHIES